MKKRTAILKAFAALALTACFAALFIPARKAAAVDWTTPSDLTEGTSESTYFAHVIDVTGDGYEWVNPDNRFSYVKYNAETKVLSVQNYNGGPIKFVHDSDSDEITVRFTGNGSTITGCGSYDGNGNGAGIYAENAALTVMGRGCTVNINLYGSETAGKYSGSELWGIRAHRLTLGTLTDDAMTYNINLYGNNVQNLVAIGAEGLSTGYETQYAVEENVSLNINTVNGKQTWGIRSTSANLCSVSLTDCVINLNASGFSGQVCGIGLGKYTTLYDSAELNVTAGSSEWANVMAVYATGSASASDSIVFDGAVTTLTIDSGANSQLSAYLIKTNRNISFVNNAEKSPLLSYIEKDPDNLPLKSYGICATKANVSIADTTLKLCCEHPIFMEDGVSAGVTPTAAYAYKLTLSGSTKAYLTAINTESYGTAEAITSHGGIDLDLNSHGGIAARVYGVTGKVMIDAGSAASGSGITDLGGFTETTADGVSHTSKSHKAVYPSGTSVSGSYSVTDTKYYDNSSLGSDTAYTMIRVLPVYIKNDFANYGGILIRTSQSDFMLNSSESAPETYELTVEGGSGSGSYCTGDYVSISAKRAELGSVFTGWELTSGSGSISNYMSENARLTALNAGFWMGGTATVSATYGDSGIFVTEPEASYTASSDSFITFTIDVDFDALDQYADYSWDTSEIEDEIVDACLYYVNEDGTLGSFSAESASSEEFMHSDCIHIAVMSEDGKNQPASGAVSLGDNVYRYTYYMTKPSYMDYDTETSYVFVLTHYWAYDDKIEANGDYLTTTSFTVTWTKPPEEYTVTFLPGLSEGSYTGSMPQKTVYENTSFLIPDADLYFDPVEDVGFTGWTVTGDESGTVYLDNAIGLNHVGTTVAASYVTENLTAVANWTVNTYMHYTETVIWDGDYTEPVLLLYEENADDRDIRADIRKTAPELALSYTPLLASHYSENGYNRDVFRFLDIPSGNYKVAVYVPGHDVYIKEVVWNCITEGDINTRLVRYGTDGLPAYRLLLSSTEVQTKQDSFADAYALLDSELNKSLTSAAKLLDLTSLGLTASEVLSVTEAYLSDHPEVFWVSSYSASANASRTTLTLVFSAFGSTLEAEKAELSARVSEIVTEAEGYLAVNSVTWLQFLTDTLALDTVKQSGKNTAYDVLVSGEGSSKGYAKALQLLLNGLEVEALTVDGLLDGETHSYVVFEKGSSGTYYFADPYLADWGSTRDDVYYSTYTRGEEAFSEFGITKVAGTTGKYGFYTAYDSVIAFADAPYLPYYFSSWYASYDASSTEGHKYYLAAPGDGSTFSSYSLLTYAEALDQNTFRFFVTGDSWLESVTKTAADGSVCLAVAKELGITNNGNVAFSYKNVGREVHLTLLCGAKSTFTLNETEAALKVGESFTLVPEISPSGSLSTVSFAADGTGSVTIDPDTGLVTATYPGTVVITATLSPEGTTAECVLTITGGEANGISLDKNELTLAAGGSALLTATLYPEGCDGKAVWTSADSSAVTVSDSGLVTALKYSKYAITVFARTENGVCQDTCRVTTLFRDVTDSGKYYYTPVYWAAKNGITSGMPGSVEFGVGSTCTRDQFAMFLWKLSGSPAVTNAELSAAAAAFSDFDSLSSANFKKAVAWAYAKGIIKGYTSGSYAGKFGVNKSITRIEAMIMLYRLQGKPEPASYSLVKTFTDVEGVYAKDSDTYRSVAWAASLGITKGYTSAASIPSGYSELTVPCFGCRIDCYRQDMITFLYRYAAAYGIMQD